MAKSNKGRPKKPGGEGTPVRIDADIVSRARYVAAARGIPVSELLSVLLRPLVEKEFRKEAKGLMGGDQP